MKNPETKRPVTCSGWYETADGRAAYFKTDGMDRDGRTGVRCSEIRDRYEVRHLVDVLL